MGLIYCKGMLAKNKCTKKQGKLVREEEYVHHAKKRRSCNVGILGVLDENDSRKGLEKV